MDIKDYHHFALGISSKADVETLDTYENKINHYKSRNYTYIPIPSENKYYNTEESLMRAINQNQYIHKGTHLVDVLCLLQKEPFLLADIEIGKYFIRYKNGNISSYDVGDRVYEERYPNKDKVEKNLESNKFFEIEKMDKIYTVFELEEEYPEIAEDRLRNEEERYEIITLADLNKRGMKEMLYRVFAELASSLSENIEKKYPESESVLKNVNYRTIGRWKEDKINGLDLHVAEHMNLLDMMNVIQATDSQFVKECGFESKKDVEMLNKINEIRKRVMHANRSLIYERGDIQKVLDSMNDAQRIISNME